MSKKVVSVLLAMFLFALPLAACSNTGQPTSNPAASSQAGSTSDNPAAPASGETIKIGGIYPLTGDVAAIGTNVQRGIQFAVDEINAAGGIHGRQIEMVWGDTQGDPKVGMSVAEKLITQDNVVAILGAYQSAVSEVVSQVAEKYQVPMLTACSTADQLTSHGYQYYFRLAPTNSTFLKSMIDYLADMDQADMAEIKSIAIIADNTLLGQETAKWARYWAAQNNIEVLNEILYTKGASDLTSEVLSLKNTNADALLADCYISDGILLTKTMAEQNYAPNVMICKATAFIDPSFIPNTGNISNGISTALEWNADLSKGQEVNAAFYAQHNINMNGHSALSYTATWTLKTAIEQATAIDRASIRDALAALKIEGTFPGGPEIILPFDIIQFETYELNGIQYTNNCRASTVAVAQIQDGSMNTVWPFDYTENQPIVPAPFA